MNAAHRINWLFASPRYQHSPLSLSLSLSLILKPATMIITKPHVALLASPGMGHLIPVIELGKRLLTHHNLDVTIFIVTTESLPTRSQIIQQTSNLTSLDFVILPPVDVSGQLGPNPSLVDRLVLTMFKSLPLLRSAILSMKVRPHALIVDVFGNLAFPLARELGMLCYVFMTTSAWFVAVTVYASVIDKEMEDRHINDHEPMFVPGCQPLQFEDTFEPFLLRDKPMYEGFHKASEDTRTADGILVNTWQDLEPRTVKALREEDILGKIIKGPIFTVGPLTHQPADHGNEVLHWLDRQPVESVIYVSFGSGGTLPTEQITELACGLELSRQRFVWVVRPPLEDDASGSFLNVANGKDRTPDYLPEGFVTRTHEVGLVVPMWAPQAEILGHPATRAFLTHCGWNSTLESIMNGVPMIAWPLYAEQKMNAAMLSEELGVAVRVKVTQNGVVGREEILKLIKRVMVEKEGKGMREKIKQLKHSGEKALSEVGSSYKSTKDFEIYLQSQGSKTKSLGA